MTLDEFELEFGYNSRREELIRGLKTAMEWLKACGCTKIYVDGSFVTKKEIPGDFDACWDYTGVDIVMLQSQYPLLLDFENSRENQKRQLKGELFPAQIPADEHSTIFVDFFQRDRDGKAKGIIQINLI